MQASSWLAVALFGLLMAGTAEAANQEIRPSPGAGAESPNLWQAADELRQPKDFDALQPGESTREDVIAALGEPRREFNYYTEEGWVPVQLQGRTSRYGPDGEVRVLLRVLGYPGDRHRDAYYAVLRDDVLQYVIGPVNPEERDLEALRQRYGEPEMKSYQRRGPLTARQVAWYPQQGLAFIREPYLDDRFNAKLVMEPRDNVPNAHSNLAVIRPHRGTARRGDTTANDTEGAFDQLDVDFADPNGGQDRTEAGEDR